MKQIMIACILVLGLGTVRAQDKPQKQKVYSFVKVRHTMEWYQEQRGLWEEEIKSHPKNADAWLNLFTATRMIRLCSGPVTDADIKVLLEKAATSIPDTFEYNYMMHWNQGVAGKTNQYLEKAYQLGPDRPEIFDDYITYYEIKRDKVHLKEFCEKTFAANEISPGLLAWNYNMLVSCNSNSILLTAGDNDTYPAWVMQYARGVRPDVTVLNVYLLAKIADYRNACFRELGIPEYKVPDETAAFDRIVQDMCKHIQQNTQRTLYYAATVPKNMYSDTESKLYSVGVVLQFASERFDNLAVLRKNVEQNYLKDYIRNPMLNDISQSVVNDINAVYLAPFITLYKHYRDSGERIKQEDLGNLVKYIAEKSNLLAEVTNMMGEP